MEDLKCCPFCGAQAECGVEFYKSGGCEVSLRAIVRCTKCHVYKSTIFKASDPLSLVSFYDYENAFSNVVKKWNQRAE